MFAYTIGNTKIYDQGLAEQNYVLGWAEPGSLMKIGVRLKDIPSYPGGAIWRTPEEAAQYIKKKGDTLGFKASVYEVQLPTDWETDVSSELGESGESHHLLNDAIILRKVQVIR